MKGQKQKEKEKYLDRAKTLNTKKSAEKKNTMGFTYLDLVPIEFTKENVMEWLANSGWIEGSIIKMLGDQFPFLDDYIQEIYLLIFDKIDRLIDVYEERGILAFCGYVKMIIRIACFSTGAQTYKNMRKFSKDLTVSLDQENWNALIDTYDAETMPFYKFNKTNDLI